MKACICLFVVVFSFAYVQLHAQDIEAKLSGNSSGQGFTVKNNSGTSLFTIRGNGKVGIGTTTPNAVLTVAGLDGFLVTGTISTGSIPATGAGTRMMFYPAKGAFRAGGVLGTEWDDSNIGIHSTAMGYRTTASLNYSTAMGRLATASAFCSTAMGSATTASGSYSTSMGIATTASGLYSTAVGRGNTASGESSTAIRSQTDASGFSAVAMGSYTTASGDISTAMGSKVNTNSKAGTFMIGDNATSAGILYANSNNRFYARFVNGYTLYTNVATSVGAVLNANANSWSTISDARKKERFLPVQGESVLERFRNLRLGTWNYKSQSAEQFRHYGPMAQEWFAAFGHDDIGTIGNDTTLASADVDGVLCIAVQALEKRTAAQMDDLTSVNEQVTVLQGKLQEKDREILQLKSHLAAHQQATDERYAELQKLVQALQQDRQGQDQRQVMLLRAGAEK